MKIKVKVKAFLFAALATITLMGLYVPAQAQTPQSCYDGYEYLGARKYNKAVAKLSTCLRSSVLTTEVRATSHYNRALSYYYMYEEEEYVQKNEEKAYKILSKAFDDIEKSIELDPTGNADAYCVRGWIDLEGSWGFYGYEDLEKGIAMGASKDWCN